MALRVCTSPRATGDRRQLSLKAVWPLSLRSESEQINGETYASLLRQGASRGLGLQAGEVAAFANHQARRRIRNFAVTSILIGGLLLLAGLLT